MSGIARFRTFVQDMTLLVEQAAGDEPTVLGEGRALLGRLVGTDDWLPDEFARPDTASYRQYLLWCDPLERFSVVSFVWGPGQKTPVHDHTVWGLIGMLRGAETATSYARDGNRLVTDGPFAETREQLGGYFLIDAKDLDEAIGIAERIPVAHRGTVEVRPVIEIPGLPTE